MTKFETGKTYKTTLATSHDTTLYFTVVKRTAQTVTLRGAVEAGEDGVKTYRISKKLSEYLGTEVIKPWGDYSMAPSLKADRVHTVSYDTSLN